MFTYKYIYVHILYSMVFESAKLHEFDLLLDCGWINAICIWVDLLMLHGEAGICSAREMS